MRFESLLIKLGMEEKSFSFSPRNNIIFSQENSRGKTTLLRLLLYSLGYSIPGTKHFRFDKCETEVSLSTDSGRAIRLVRPSKDHVVLYSGMEQSTFCLPDQKNQLDRILFEISNDDVINNLLGVFYLDQEKGWTLLNRGTVIGNIHFSVEDIILGLSNKDCSNLKEEEARLRRELLRFQQIANVKKYKESLELESGSMLTEKYDDEIDIDIAQKQLDINDIQKELNRIDRVLQDNLQIKKFVEKMKLRVRMPDGESMLITSEKIIDLNDSIDYLIAKRKMKAAEYRVLSNSLKASQQKKHKLEEPKLVDVESVADLFDEMVQKFPLGYVNVERAIEKIKASIDEIETQISDAIRKDNDIVTSLHKSVIKYADELSIGNNSSIAESYLFTNNLKELSGAILHKTVFSFRLAFILEIKKRFGIVLPIILDSPSGKELDDNNIGIMMSILNRDFSDHQLIIASIRKYDLPMPNIIELQSTLMENSVINGNKS